MTDIRKGILKKRLVWSVDGFTGQPRPERGWSGWRQGSVAARRPRCPRAGNPPLAAGRRRPESGAHPPRARAEIQTWSASQALDLADHAKDSLSTFKATVDVLYDKTFGGAAQFFKINGSRDDTLYSGSQTGSPNSDGFIFQVNYLPFNKTTGPKFWPRSNVKLSLQYTMYDRFDGGTSNIDGLGRAAHANNTLYLEGWIAF